MIRRSGKILTFQGILVLSAILLAVGAVRVEAATWYAAPGATGSGKSAADPGDLRSLVMAGSAAGDTVILAAGTYEIAIKEGGQLDVKHRLNLVGAGRGKTILKSLNSVCILIIEAEDSKPGNMVIKSMTFRDGGSYQVDLLKGSPTFEDVEFVGKAINSSLISRDGRPVVKKSFFKAKARSGLYAGTPGAPLSVTGCEFSVTGGYGIDFISVDSGAIVKNTFKGNRVGVHIYATTTVWNTKTSASLIRNNTFKNNIWGIDLHTSPDGIGRCTISGNTFRSNKYGIEATSDSQGLERAKIDSNRFISNTYAMMLRTTRNTVINNLFVGNTKTGISSTGGISTIAFNTVARGGGDGIKLMVGSKLTGDRSLVVNNIFCSNADYGISLDEFSKGVQLGGNDIFGNKLGVISGVYVDLGGGLTVSPKFKAGSYALAAGSPLIDRAIDAYTAAYDITGASRTKPDIGAYEYKK